MNCRCKASIPCGEGFKRGDYIERSIEMISETNSIEQITRAMILKKRRVMNAIEQKHESCMYYEDTQPQRWELLSYHVIYNEMEAAGELPRYVKWAVIQSRITVTSSASASSEHRLRNELNIRCSEQSKSGLSPAPSAR